MFRLVRTRRFAFASVTAVGIVVLGGAFLAAAGGSGNRDAQPRVNSTIAVCSDVPFHVSVIVNTGTEAHPDDRREGSEMQPTGHGRDPFAGNRGCAVLGAAFGSRVELRTPGLNEGEPSSVTASADDKHDLVVRLTKNADDTVTETRQLVAVGS